MRISPAASNMLGPDFVEEIELPVMMEPLSSATKAQASG